MTTQPFIFYCTRWNKSTHCYVHLHCLFL